MFNPQTSVLHQLILSDRQYLDKRNQIFAFLNHLEQVPRLGYPPVNLVIRPRGFGISLAAEAVEALLDRDQLLMDKLSAHGAMPDRLPDCEVIHLSLTKVRAATVKDFTNTLMEMLQMQMWEHHINSGLILYPDPRTAFLRLIEAVAERSGKDVVILIDNYDVPFYLAARLRKKEDRSRALAVYFDTLNAIRTAGSCVRWCLLTGHLKFRLASEISEGLPLINDLSFAAVCDTMFGFTLKDIEESYGRDLKRVAPRHGVTAAEYLNALDHCYGGYVFSDRMKRVINPSSVTAALENDGNLYPYSARGDYSFMRRCLDEKEPNLSWLFNRDGQDALGWNALDLDIRNKQFGTMLIQLGFASLNKVLFDEEENSLTWRYRYDAPNEEMRRILRVFLGREDKSILRHPIHPLVFDCNEDDYLR